MNSVVLSPERYKPYHEDQQKNSPTLIEAENKFDTKKDATFNK